MSQAKPTRRRSSPHPGVRVLQITSRSGRRFCQARYTDPDTGRLVCESLDAKNILNADGRRSWAINKSVELQRRRAELHFGAERHQDVRLQDAIRDYLAICDATLRPKTSRGYRDAMDQFSSWAKKGGVETTSQINVRVLARYREHIIQTPKRSTLRGGRRGQRGQTKVGRAPRTLNREMTYISTALRAWVRSGLLPGLSRDAIADAFRRVPGSKPQPTFLSFGEAQQLLTAAMAHDDAAFELTREEKIKRLLGGRTRRYDAIAPITLFLLLSGARRGEAIALEWKDVHIDALDENGNAVGEVIVRPEASKTRSSRRIDLGLCPALRRLLLGMRERRGEEASVFRLTEDQLVTAQRRLVRSYGAPARFTWQLLRSTCATVLANAGSMFGGSAAFRESRQLGHSIVVAERYYVGLLRGVPASAKSVEAALQVEDLAGKIVEMVAQRGEAGLVVGVA